MAGWRAMRASASLSCWMRSQHEQHQAWNAKDQNTISKSENVGYGGSRTFRQSVAKSPLSLGLLRWRISWRWSRLPTQCRPTRADAYQAMHYFPTASTEQTRLYIEPLGALGEGARTEKLMGDQPETSPWFSSLWWVLPKVMQGQQQVMQHVSAGLKQLKKPFDHCASPGALVMTVWSLAATLNFSIQPSMSFCMSDLGACWL